MTGSLIPPFSQANTSNYHQANAFNSNHMIFPYSNSQMFSSSPLASPMKIETQDRPEGQKADNRIYQAVESLKLSMEDKFFTGAESSKDNKYRDWINE